MQFQKFVVKFDDGREVEAEIKSRDLARLERDGVSVEETPPIQGSYLLAFTAMQRMKRSGRIDFDIPATVEDLMDNADIEVVEDAPGEGSGQAAVTG